MIPLASLKERGCGKWSMKTNLAVYADAKGPCRFHGFGFGVINVAEYLPGAASEKFHCTLLTMSGWVSPKLLSTFGNRHHVRED